MNEIGLALYIRVALLAIGLIILLVNTGALVRFWKRLEISQRLFVIGCLCMQAFVLDELREFIYEEREFRLRLVLLLIGFFAFAADILYPSKSRDRSMERVLNDLSDEK